MQGLHCSMQASLVVVRGLLSGRGTRASLWSWYAGFSLVVVRGLLSGCGTRASLIVVHRLLHRLLSSRGTQASPRASLWSWYTGSRAHGLCGCGARASCLEACGILVA